MSARPIPRPVAARVVPLPTTDLITGRVEEQLTAARTTAQAVEAGQYVSSPQMQVAAEVFATHGHDTDEALITILDAGILARRREISQQAKRGTIRAALWDVAGLAVIAGAAVGVLWL